MLYKVKMDVDESFLFILFTCIKWLTLHIYTIIKTQSQTFSYAVKNLIHNKGVLDSST